ncbi:MAG: 23S rRNA pseudouridine(1911/1915/1917) synthase RluD [Gammaproteobacteria bacterium]|nr:23S rRNA pseudouridine(1911/1915/1917) synthase RluD [Gammaproteobacteria bacterium]
MKEDEIELSIRADLGGTRLDHALAMMLPDYSRARIQGWIRAGRIHLDRHVCRPRDRVSGGEHVVIRPEFPRDERWQGQDIPLDIVFADAHILVINKPAGLVVHPGPGNPDRTLVNALIHHDEGLAAMPRAGVVHRLDKDTSGLMVVARSPAAHRSLVDQLKDRTVGREYQAIIVGVMTAGGTVDAPIGRHPSRRVAMAVVARGRPAVTHHRVLARFRAHSHVRVRLETGRTHQIRVHMAHIGYPLVGDPLYGKRLHIPRGCSAELEQALRGFGRQALHARRLALIHPHSGEELTWEAPPPGDFRHLLDELARDAAAKT